MQAAPCAWGASIHAASLLTSLNLQREQGQFCDVVLRPKQDPGELYPAHRCVLAASSPVLASILLSTGALVELQALCLSDSVLPLLYTSFIPGICHTLAASTSITTCSLLPATFRWMVCRRL
ncbi:zinc finger and BTB domain-containing protein 20-like isoform X2 [Gymnodraco acuticeps]|uniref:Zinc finger and BTB domain-containing protein 20-like isoform X2 n=1 Tax=Gymnodraco acuticeps TaxID=8218 RepID=A0A6P8VCW6_GYMAC|nr:zinc finger and BTB domain-containing protein 20-like isoform X2 [Gymnodraco acuticeps]